MAKHMNEWVFRADHPERLPVGPKVHLEFEYDVLQKDVDYI